MKFKRQPWAQAQWPLLDATRLVRGVYRVLWGSRAELDKAECEVENWLLNQFRLVYGGALIGVEF